MWICITSFKFMPLLLNLLGCKYRNKILSFSKYYYETILNRESSFTDVQRKAFYMQVPAMMYHFPHMFFIQQRILQGKQKQMAVRAENAAADRIKKAGE